MNHLSTILRRGIVLAMVLATAYAMQAQSPRMVVMEECTNASCGPCAAQNPYYEAWVALPSTQQRVLPLCYRANYPGTDVMNAANPTMHNARVTYYSNATFTPHVTGVPTAIVNGIVPNSSGSGYAGAPSDTRALGMAVDATPATSPITITIDEQRTGTTANITVNVSSTTAISGKVLQIVAVENYHYYANAGGNGEKDFMHIARQMMPSASGTPLTLAANETRTVTQSYTIDPAWNKDQMYVLAFVQDDATHEILQGASNQGKVIPSIDGGMIKVQAAATDPAKWSGTLTTNNTGKYLVNITKNAPSGWVPSIKIGNAAVNDGDSIALTSGGTVPLDIEFTIPGGAKPAKGVVTVTFSGDHGAKTTQVYKFYSAGAQALVLVKDEGTATIAAAYDRAMGRRTMPYLMVDNGDEGLFNWKNYQVVVYEVGKSIVDQPDVDMLKGYMDNGGRLYLIGAEIAWGLMDPGAATSGYYADPAFVKNYLHADYVGDTGPSFTIYGAAGDPIGNTLTFPINNGVQNQDTPDELKVLKGAKPAFFYGPESQNHVAGLRYSDNKYRLVYLGFGVEGIGNDSVRARVLDQGIQWLLGSEITVGINESVTIDGSVFGSLRPNPTTGMMQMPVTLAAPARITARLYDASGSLVGTVTDRDYQAGSTVLRYNGSALPAGVYTLVVNTGSALTARTVTVVR